MSNLTECKDCNHVVSRRAAICPNCGVSFPGRVQPQIIGQFWTALMHIPYLRLLKKAAQVGAVVGLGMIVIGHLLGDEGSAFVLLIGSFYFGCTVVIVWVGLILWGLARQVVKLRERD